MTFYPSHLCEDHRRQIEEESGVDPEIAAERGYATVRSRTELLDFKKYQRRAPALRIPLYSPDGETQSAQIRPDNPRKDKKGKPLKYETPGGSRVILDVHPRMLEEVRVGDGDLWITEGIKKADSLTSRGLPTIGLIGVWNWQRGGEMLPCWDHVRLDGCRVYIVFDSDVMTKEGVQLALERLVASLEARGAEVLVVYLPDAADGSKNGVDDYLAAGGTVNELKMLARRFEPQDLGRIRLSRDEKLRAGVEDLERRWWGEEWKGRGGHSERDVAHQLIEAATRSGKIHADGLRVRASWGTLQVGAKMARRTLAKALARLEERGFLYRDNEGRKAEKAGAFVLRAKVDHKGSTEATEEKVTQELRTCDPGGLPLRGPVRGLPDVSRLRWSRPAWKPSKKMIREYREGKRSVLPEPRERIERLGKIRGAVVDALAVSGGESSVADLGAILGRRPRDLTRRKKPGSKGRDGDLVMLEEAGVIVCGGDVVRLAADWREALEAERRDKGEASYAYTIEYTDNAGEVQEKTVRVVGADELAEDHRKRKSWAYRERDKAPVSKPSAAGEAAVRRSNAERSKHIAAHEEHQAKARVVDVAAKSFAKCFVHDRMRVLGRIRLELLQHALKDAGGVPGYALPAAKSLGCKVERLLDYSNAEFVFAPAEWAAA